VREAREKNDQKKKEFNELLNEKLANEEEIKKEIKIE